jgi:hypothetical protein
MNCVRLLGGSVALVLASFPIDCSSGNFQVTLLSLGCEKKEKSKPLCRVGLGSVETLAGFCGGFSQKVIEA